jgi:glycosyltransferase involved in cell wall biosynthesis
MMEMKESVDVIIPTYNGKEILITLLDSLRTQDYAGKIRVIIVDSGSTDGTVEMVSKYDKLSIKLIRIDNKHFTHSYSRNLGAEQSSADILLFMTQDAIPEDEKWLSKMIEPLGKGYVAVSCAEDTTDCPDLFYKIGSHFYQKDIGILNQDIECSYSQGMSTAEIRKNSSLNDIACLIRREVFERYKYRGDYAEDLDLGKRLIMDDYKLKLLGTVHVMHYHDRTAYYYMKRQYVETKAIWNILGRNQCDYPVLSNIQISWLICQSYISVYIVQEILNKLPIHFRNKEIEVKIRLFLFRQLLKIIEKRHFNENKISEICEKYRSKASLDGDIQRIMENEKDNYNASWFARNAIMDIRGYLKYRFEKYAIIDNIHKEKLDSVIFSCIIKELSRIIGG